LLKQMGRIMLADVIMGNNDRLAVPAVFDSSAANLGNLIVVYVPGGALSMIPIDQEVNVDFLHGAGPAHPEKMQAKLRSPPSWAQSLDALTHQLKTDGLPLPDEQAEFTAEQKEVFVEGVEDAVTRAVKAFARGSDLQSEWGKAAADVGLGDVWHLDVSQKMVSMVAQNLQVLLDMFPERARAPSDVVPDNALQSRRELPLGGGLASFNAFAVAAEQDRERRHSQQAAEGLLEDEDRGSAASEDEELEEPITDHAHVPCMSVEVYCRTARCVSARCSVQ